jgi:hypothetical protein
LHAEALARRLIDRQAAARAPRCAGGARQAIVQLYNGQSLQTGGAESDYIMYALGAEFVEVRVHARTRARLL